MFAKGGYIRSQASSRRNHSFPNDFDFSFKFVRRICRGTLAPERNANYSCVAASAPVVGTPDMSSSNRAQGMPMNDVNMADHIQVDRYGDFWLTDAIRPAQALAVVPRQGY